ncbi:MAG: hypothetical protein FWG87_06705 [Defluviitaleaceae bacterium]|nr:hypothetical protein [Defluviitaleaceae bacterium]
MPPHCKRADGKCTNGKCTNGKTHTVLCRGRIYPPPTTPRADHDYTDLKTRLKKSVKIR